MQVSFEMLFKGIDDMSLVLTTLMHITSRDLLSWPGITNVDKDKDDLQMGQVPKRDDLPGRVTSLLRVFCPIIQCLGPFCYTHHHGIQFSTKVL